MQDASTALLWKHLQRGGSDSFSLLLLLSFPPPGGVPDTASYRGVFLGAQVIKQGEVNKNLSILLTSVRLGVV